MTHAVILHPDDFERFTAQVTEQITKHFENMKGSVIEKPMCAKEAADYLGVTPKTLHERIRTGVIPANLKHEISGSVYFFPSELHSFIKKH